MHCINLHFTHIIMCVSNSMTEGTLCGKCKDGYGIIALYCNEVSAGNMVMDWSCTISPNSFQ